jgi:uncharacterized protein (TIGR03067 family)
MKKQLLWLLAAPLLMTSLASGVGEKKGDLELVQGAWVVVSVEADGKPVPEGTTAFELKGLELVVTGNKVVAKIPPEALKGKAPAISFRIDAKARPKSVDIGVLELGYEREFKGIYSLEGDKLTVCIGEGGKSERPTDFTTKEGSRRILGVFKRMVK